MAEQSEFPGNGASRTPFFSPDGTKLYFQSAASNLVAGDTNGVADIFEKDLATGAIRRVSTTTTGAQSNGAASPFSAISPDGTKLAFASSATNLSTNDTNDADDVFVKDLTTGVVTLVSATPTGQTGNGTSNQPAFTPDGTKIGFVSSASDLTADGATGTNNLFIRDLTTGVTTRESTPVDENSGQPDYIGRPDFSSDGTKLLYNATFSSGSDINSVIKDLDTGQSEFLLPPLNQQVFAYTIEPVFSPDGSKVAFRSEQGLVEADDNRANDIYIKDLASGQVSLVSANAEGEVGDQDSYQPSFSPDGSKVVFTSYSSNLVEGDDNGASDVFIKDLASGEIVRVSVGPDGSEGTGIPGFGGSQSGVFSPDGTKIAFESRQSFVAGDTNGSTNDIYIKDLTTGEITLASTATQPPCYCTGTLIRTPGGDVAVEHLRIGDTIVTADGAHRPIRWIGIRAYAPRFANANPDLLPVRVAAGALADGVPARDLHVSPKHALVLDGLLVPADLLVNGVTITRATRAADDLTYWHVELDSHDVLLAEGAPAESFLDDDSRALFHNAASHRALYPEAQDGGGTYCLPRVEDGYALDAIRRRLRARAGLPVAGPVFGPLEGGFSVAEGRLTGWARDAAHPGVPVILDVYAGGEHLAQLCADEDGAQGFSLPLPAGTGPVSVRRSGDGASLPGLSRAA